MPVKFSTLSSTPRYIYIYIYTHANSPITNTMGNCLQACPRAEFVLESTFCTQYKITKRLGLYLENLSLETMDFVLGRRQSFSLECLAADGSCAVQNQYTGFVKQKNLD